MSMSASSFNSTSTAAVAQTFALGAVPASNNTASPSANLQLLFGSGASAPTATGLSIAPTGKITFAAGQTTQTIDVPVLLDPNITGTVTFTVDLSSPSSNALLDGGQATGTITDLPVSQLPFSSGTRATYLDNDGHRVTVTLSGPGSGVVSVVGTDAGTEQVTIATTDTTARTRLTIASAGGDTTLDGLAVTGSLGTLAAATVDLAGDLTVTGTIGPPQPGPYARLGPVPFGLAFTLIAVAGLAIGGRRP